MKILSGMFLLGMSALILSGKDIDLEKHVKQHWLRFQNKKIEVAPLVRWKASDEVKAQRLEYFKDCLRRFAPHLLDEYARIDKALGLPPGTYVGIVRFGAKLTDLQPKPEHECTSWIMMPDVTDGKSILMHKNRDSKGRPLVLQRRAVPGKHAWIGNGYCTSFNPTQGINDRGVVVLMNSGDPVMEIENTQYGLLTTVVARILLEECGTAEEAVKLLTKIIQDNAFSHVDCGSIFIIGDKNNVYIVESTTRVVVSKAVNSGLIVRANTFHYPELQKYSLNNPKRMGSYARREFAVRDHLIRAWRENGLITPYDNAAASRLDKVADDWTPCTPPCSRSTISATTFSIDLEYPEYLSTAYMVFSSPRSSCYLPVPVTIDELPDELVNGKYSARAFERMDKKLPFLPEKELKELETKLYKRHADAVAAARKELHKNAGRDKAAEILKKAFQANWAEIIAAEKNSPAPKKPEK